MENENNVDTQVVEEKTVEKETTQKTYTVDDINNSFNAGFKKARAEMKEYQELEKTNQNNNEKITTLETENTNIKNENAQLKETLQGYKLKDSNVKEEFKEFVISKVNSMVNDDVDFDTALETFKKENSQYFGETVVKKVQSSPTLAGGIKPQSLNEVMNNFIRNN